MRIALFGGSFNPVHNGHIALARALVADYGYDRVAFVPAHHSPFKNLPGDTTDEDRLFMLRAALESEPWACVETCELERGGVSYTYDTVVSLTEKYRATGLLTGKLGLLVGSDLASTFKDWHRVEELVPLVDILLARRPCPDADKSGVAAGFPFPHIPVANELHDISSSGVREVVGRGGSAFPLVPEPVYRYILGRGLYVHQL